MSTTNSSYDHQPAVRRGMPGWLKGCLIAFAIFVLIVVLGVWWLYSNASRLITGLGVSVVENVIASSDLPEAEKAEINVELQRLRDAADQGKVGRPELDKLSKELRESPFLATFVMLSVEAQYFDKSGLGDDEKAKGRQAVRRVMHGAREKSISDAKIQALLGMISTTDADGNQQLKETLTDDELRAFFAAAGQTADESNVPAEVPEVDPSDEIGRIIDVTLGVAPAN